MAAGLAEDVSAVEMYTVQAVEDVSAARLVQYAQDVSVAWYIGY